MDPLGTETDTDSDEDIEKELAEMEGLVRPKKKRRRNKMGDVKKVLKPMQMNSENNITGSKVGFFFYFSIGHGFNCRIEKFCWSFGGRICTSYSKQCILLLFLYKTAG